MLAIATCTWLLQFGDIVGDDENVVKVEAAAGVVQDADEVLEINALVRIEELVGVHLEGIEDERHLIFRAHPSGNPERVVKSGIFGMLGINQAKLVRSSSRAYGRQEALEKLLFAFAVHDNDRTAASDVLLGKRLQQR